MRLNAVGGPGQAPRSLWGPSRVGWAPVPGIRAPAKSTKPAAVASFINARKDEGQRARHIDTQGFADRERLAELYRRYEAACERGGMVDFGELLLRSNELWVQQPALRDHYRRRFRHILVD